MKRRVMGSLMAVLMGASTVASTCPAPIFAADTNVQENTVDADIVASGENYGLTSVTQGNILHAWNWSLKTIKEQLPTIAKSGYSVVQTSPLQSCESFSNNNDWWKSYQPYDYAFGSVYGSEAEFKELCAEADKYGISIIVDIVANHVASEDKVHGYALKAGVADFWKSDSSLFHNSGKEYGTDDGGDEDREGMVLHNIGMADINTESEKVQQRLVSYMKQLIADGADGFRFDAAKHIGTSSDSGSSSSSFWKNTVGVVKAENPSLLYYGEILNDMECSPDPMTYYVKDGIKVTESQIGWAFKDAVQKGTLATHSTSHKAQVITYNRSAKCGIAESDQVNWVENHDTYLNHWGSTGLEGAGNYMSDAQVVLSWSALASRANTQSLYFARPDGCTYPDGEPTNTASNHIYGTIADLTKNGTWKDQKVVAVNKFKNAMIGEGEDVSSSGNTTIVKRGNKGVVITNFGSGDASFNVSGLTGLKDGTYQDASGQNGSFTVSGGNVSGQVKGNTFVVLYDANAVVTPTTAPTTEPVVTTAATEAPAPSGTATVTTAPTTTVTGDVKVSISKESDNFTDAFEVTVKAENAAAAYYSYDGADWTAFTGTEKITVGKEKLTAGDQVAVYVAAYDQNGKLVQTSATYTKQVVTTTTAPAYDGLCIKVKKSDFDSAPHIYVYGTDAEGNVKEYTGAYGTCAFMTEEGDYYVFKTSDTKSAKFIIWIDTYRSTPHGADGIDASETVIFDKASCTVKAEAGETVTVTEAPTGTKEAGKAGEVPVFQAATEAPATEAPATEVPATEVPATEAPATETPDDTKDANTIAVSVDNGTTFDTETLAVTITLPEGQEGSYQVDNGVTKKFTGSTTVKVGEGKIADTDVTLTVTAGTEKKTYTYKKEFNKAKAAQEQEVRTSAVVVIQSIAEKVLEASQVNADAISTAYYATNPSKQVGTCKTISSMSDFNESDKIACAGAWDVANRWKGGHENSVADCYGLYAAYDDTNLYIGVEYVNTTDTWANAGDGPLSDGGKMVDIPVILALNTGKGNAMTGKCPTDKDGHPWQCNLEFQTRIDHMFISSAKLSGTPGIFTADESGNTDYKTHLKGFKESGVTLVKEDGSISSKIMMMTGSGDASNLEENLDDSKYVDAMTQNHDRKYDSFYIYTIPYSAIDIDKSYLESNGIGVMAIGTRQTSAMDCIPFDQCMLDNATGDYSQDPSTSLEKEDLDTITVPLAAVGSVNAIGSGGGGDIVTPVQTTAPVQTTSVEPTQDVAVSPAPDTTTAPVVTVAPTTDVTEKTVAPITSAAVVPTDNAGNNEQSVDSNKETDAMVVNFGADLSAPQAAGTELTLKAIPYNVSGNCEYQYSIDGQEVEGTQDSITWKPEAGVHEIAVTVTDQEGKTVTVSKQYTVENDGSVVVTAQPETGSDATATDSAFATDAPNVQPGATTAGNIDSTEGQTQTQTPTATTNNQVVNNQTVPNAGTAKTPISAKMKFTVAAPQKVNTEIGVSPVEVQGGSGSYTYKLVASLKDSTETVVIADAVPGSTVTLWKPEKAGTYELYMTVTDSADVSNKATVQQEYKITAASANKKLAITNAKVSKKKIKLGKKIKITAAGTAAKGTLKFKFSAQNGKKTTVLKKYNTKKTYTWKPKKAGTYKIIIQAKDGSGKTVKKTLKVVVKK